jgi:hypothetical protein
VQSNNCVGFALRADPAPNATRRRRSIDGEEERGRGVDGREGVFLRETGREEVQG